MYQVVCFCKNLIQITYILKGYRIVKDLKIGITSWQTWPEYAASHVTSLNQSKWVILE